ncbi:glycosyl hydrolase family 98 C-terminal domain-containing protein [Arcanobacterium hippocoleae]
MISNSGTTIPPSKEWIESLYKTYPNMIGVFMSENHNFTGNLAQTRSKWMSEQLQLAAKYGGYVVYCEMNDNGDFMEKVLREPIALNSLKQYKDNFILLAKTTSAWSKVSYNSHESVTAGAWLSDIAGNWGSLIDTWMWQIEGYGPLWGKDTFDTFGGPEECRGPVTFPELFFEMRMIQQAQNGAAVFSFEHPDYATSVGTDNGSKNYFTPSFTESIMPAMEYMRDHKIPTKDEVLAKTKAAYDAREGSLNDLAGAGVNLLNPLYGDTNFNGKNNTTLLAHKTGRYGIIPSLLPGVSEEVIAKFPNLLTKNKVLNELKNEAGIKTYFDKLYPETYEGDGFASKVGNTWLAYNSNWMIDSRKDSELDSTQSVTLNLEQNEVQAKITFNPYSLLVLDEKDGKVRIHFNNYLADKNPIWKGYVKYGKPGATKHWDSDNDTGMYDYLLNEYIPDSKTADDRYRKAIIEISGLTHEPTLEMISALIGTDNAAQTKTPTIAYKDGAATITLEGNGWQNFDLSIVPSADPVPPAVSKDKLRTAVDTVKAAIAAAEDPKLAAALSGLLRNPEAVLQNPNAVQEDVDAACAALLKAFAELGSSEAESSGGRNAPGAESSEGRNAPGKSVQVAGKSLAKTGSAGLLGALLAALILTGAGVSVAAARQGRKNKADC